VSYVWVLLNENRGCTVGYLCSIEYNGKGEQRRKKGVSGR
jgi:hypothetical protein